MARVGSGAATLALLPGARTAIDPADWPRLLAVSVVWVGIPFTLFPLAEEHINSAVTGLLNGATHFSLVWSGRSTSTVLLGARSGGGWSSASPASRWSASARRPREGRRSWAFSWSSPRPACYGVAANLTGAIQQKYGSVAVMSKVLALATIWTVPFGLWGLSRSGFGWGAAAAVGVLGVLGTGIVFALMATLVGRVGGPRASFITYLVPVVSLILGAAFLCNDRVSAWALLGVAVGRRRGGAGVPCRVFTT